MKELNENPGELDGSQEQNDYSDNDKTWEMLIKRELSYVAICSSIETFFPVELVRCNIHICEIISPDTDKAINAIKLPKGYEGVPHEASFTLTYPFEKGRTQKIVFSSFMNIAVAVKNSYLVMYNSSDDHGRFGYSLMSHLTGPYGTSYHCFEDLYIEGVNYDPKTKRLFFNIGS